MIYACTVSHTREYQGTHPLIATWRLCMWSRPTTSLDSKFTHRDSATYSRALSPLRKDGSRLLVAPGAMIRNAARLRSTSILFHYAATLPNNRGTMLCRCFSRCLGYRKLESDDLRDVERGTKPSGDPRINDLGRAIEDEFATIRESYRKC